MNRHVLLVAAALVAAAALALLFYATRGASDAGPVRTAGAEPEPAPEEAADPRETAATASRPALPGTPEERATRSRLDTDDGDPRLHIRSEGTIVRDHRPGAGPPSENEGTIRAPRKVRRIDSTVVLAVRREMHPIVQGCRDQFRDDFEADQGKLQSEVAVSIRDGQARVVDATIQLVGVAEGRMDVCVHNEVLGIRIPAPDHQDLERHVLRFPFDLR
jgi:hypothetical protein